MLIRLTSELSGRVMQPIVRPRAHAKPWARLCSTGECHGPLQRKLEGTLLRIIGATWEPAGRKKCQLLLRYAGLLPNPIRPMQQFRGNENRELDTKAGHGFIRGKLTWETFGFKQTHESLGGCAVPKSRNCAPAGCWHCPSPFPLTSELSGRREAQDYAPACTCVAMGTPVLCANAARSAPTIVRSPMQTGLTVH